MNLNEQREFMRNNNLEMTKKLDKIIEDAKPKPIIEKRPIIPKRIIIEQDITGTPEYKATRQLSDLLLTQNLNNLITGAMNSISGNRTEKDNKVSQEVEDDFRAMNPVEVGDEKRLYYDIPIPTLPEYIPKPPTTYFTTEGEFTVERERLLTALNTATERRALIQQDIQIVEDQLNIRAYATPTGFKPSIPAYDEKARAIELKKMTDAYEKLPVLDKKGNPVKDKAGKPLYTDGKPITDLSPLLDLRDKYKIKTSARTVPGLIRAIIPFEKKLYDEQIKTEEGSFVGRRIAGTEASLKSDLIRLRGELATIEGQIASIETDITALNAEHDAFLRDIEENEVERNKIENERRLLANDALNTFNRLNQGRVQIQQEPQETDQELLDRIENIGKIQADPSDITNQIFDKAKKNILQLTPDTTKAEMTLKYLSC